MIVFNKTVFEGFTPELQEILKEEAINAQNLTRERISQGESSVIEQLKQKGMNVTIPDRQSFVLMMAPAYDKVGALAGKQEMTKLLNAVEQARVK